MLYYEIVIPCPACDTNTTIGRHEELEAQDLCDQCYGSGQRLVGDFYAGMDEVREKYPNLIRCTIIR